MFAQPLTRLSGVRFLPAHEVTTLAQPLPHSGTPPFPREDQPLSVRPFDGNRKSEPRHPDSPSSCPTQSWHRATPVECAGLLRQQVAGMGSSCGTSFALAAVFPPAQK